MEMNYDDRVSRSDSMPELAVSLTSFQELQRIEQELRIEILPGTEIMTDLDSHHFLKGGTTVLVPQPTGMSCNM